MQISDTSATFEVILDNNQILTGTMFEAVSIIGPLFLILLVLTIYLWKRLRENSRLKYEFVTIVAHKFRTPLTYVKWVCDDMIPVETDSFKKENLQNVKKSNQKLIDLTGTLIDMADSESNGSATYVYEKINLSELIRSVATDLKDMFHEKNIFLGIHCDDDKIRVKADKTRLEFVITTLLENACVYTPPGKNVEITVSKTLFKAIISVEDNGIGISKQDLPHVFSKFFRGKNAKTTDTEGFGVGLYLASSIVRQLRGKIRVDSPGENMGSKFTITLPRVR